MIDIRLVKIHTLFDQVIGFLRSKLAYKHRKVAAKNAQIGKIIDHLCHIILSLAWSRLAAYINIDNTDAIRQKYLFILYSYKLKHRFYTLFLAKYKIIVILSVL